jgi:hypothetical protein
VPFKLALVHPWLLAFAMGAMPRTSAVTAANVKFIALLLRFIILLLWEEDCSDCVFPFHHYRRQGAPETGHVTVNFLEPTRKGPPSTRARKKSRFC